MTKCECGHLQYRHIHTNLIGGVLVKWFYGECDKKGCRCPRWRPKHPVRAQG